jgi:hypothetical protein
MRSVVLAKRVDVRTHGGRSLVIVENKRVIKIDSCLLQAVPDVEINNSVIFNRRTELSSSALKENDAL